MQNHDIQAVCPSGRHKIPIRMQIFHLHNELQPQQTKLHSLPANGGQTLCQWLQKSCIEGTINRSGLLMGHLRICTVFQYQSS